MSNTRLNIDYIKLCEALEEGDKVTAQNLILNNANVYTFNESYRYNWAYIVYEALEISVICKVLQEKDKVIVQNLLLNDKLYTNKGNNSVWHNIINILLDFLNRFRRRIRHPELEGDQRTAQRSVLININNDDYISLICKPHEWVDSIFSDLNTFSKVFYSETLEEGDTIVKEKRSWSLKINNAFHPNAIEFQKWTKVISETLDIIIKRLHSGVNIHVKNPNYYNLLNVAIQKNNTLEACLFIKKGARFGDIQIFKNLNMLLLGAIEQENDTMAKVLIDYGVQKNPSINLIIPLNAAISGRQSKIIEHIIPHFQFLEESDQHIYRQAILCLEEKAKTHLQIPNNRYIFNAIKNGYRKVAQLFLDYNSDIQYISSRGDTPLHKAIENDFDIKFIKCLLKRNPPVNAANHKMFTPLLVACKTKSENQLEIVKILLQYNANVNCTDHNLRTPLHFACEARKVEVVKILLQNGANSNAKNNKGQTPLHLLYNRDYFIVRKKGSNIIMNIIELLLQHNADINAVDLKGWTPLFTACKADHEAAVKYFLENHANVNHTDSKNRNCLLIAAEYAYEMKIEIVEILLKYKINIYCTNRLGESIIHHLAASDNDKLIKRFFHTQVNFNTVDKQGNTPLHIAIKNRYVGMVKVLLKYGADINVLDNKKRTPLKKTIEDLSYHRKKLDNHDFLHQWYKSEIDSEEERTIERIQDLYTSLHLNLYIMIIRIIKIHIIKLKIAGLKVNKQNLHLFYNYNDYSASDGESSDEDYISDTENSTMDLLLLEEKCEQEIEKMKMERIGINDMTLYNLLIKNIHLLSRWIKNKKIQDIIELKIYDKKFPIYMNIIKCRFRDAQLRYRLMNPAKKYFSLNICQRLPDDCVDTVFSYLKIKEINMFIRAVKGLDE